MVDRSNLQRQVQFGEADLGQAKVDVLARRLTAMNDAIKVTPRQARFKTGFPVQGEILIDATDNFETRFDLNALAHKSGRYLVSGAASRWSGQVSVFASGLDPNAPCYRCFVPELPPAGEACDDVGVVGAMTGQVGTAMALEAIKLVTGAGEPLIGRIAMIDGLSGTTRTVNLRPDPECQVCAE